MTQFPKDEKSSSQDLSAGELSYTTNYGRPFILDQILIHFDAAVSETVTITLDANAGANYDTVLQEVVLASETDFVYRPQGKAQFKSGDEIKIQCTNTGGAGNAYVLVKASEAPV